MIHQQPPIEQPAIQAHPVNPGRSSQESTASAHSEVDVACLFEKLDRLEDVFDSLGIRRSTTAPDEIQSPPVSIETLMDRIGTLRKLFVECTGEFPDGDCSRGPLTEQTNHIN